MGERPDELRADLMETYGLALRADGAEGHDPEFVGALAAQLPPGCRWRVSYDRDAWWTGERQLQAALVNSLNGLMWGLADPKRRGSMPEAAGPSWFKNGGGGRSLPAKLIGMAELLERLSMPRKER